MTPERAGGRHRSPHGGVGAIDALSANNPWHSSNLKLPLAIIKAKHRAQAMGAAFVQALPFPSDADNAPLNAHLMAKLNRVMGAMALKEDVHVAQVGVVKPMRSELAAQLEPFSFKIRERRCQSIASQRGNEIFERAFDACCSFSV